MNAPTLTAIAGVVLLVMPLCVVSEAVTVALPAVFSVTLKFLLPLVRAVLAGNAALASLELIATVSLVLTTFQFESTALTVTLKAVPAVCAVGVPVLPLPVPGKAVSPGASSCNFTNAPGLTVTKGLVLGVLEGSSVSVAVNVWLPAVMRVTLKFFVPLISDAGDGIATALLSVVVMPTLSVTLVTRFQLASTALTVTLKGGGGAGLAGGAAGRGGFSGDQQLEFCVEAWVDGDGWAGVGGYPRVDGI